MLSMKQALLLLLPLSTSGVIADQRDTIRACLSLFKAFPEQVSFPRSQQYEDSLASFAYLGTRLRPACFASPKSTEDVAAIIRTLGKFDSVAFAVRSGGHNTNIGFANIQDGITIDLSAMDTVALDPSFSTVSVGPGNRWQKVYDALDPYGLSVQGGRNGDVGVGGFLTGGGIGFFSPERGWACDSVINFEVVLSSGMVVNANATSHTDLFTALKGGSNNFGIVTRFDLAAFKQGPLWGGIVLYSNSSDQKLLDTLVAFKKPEQFDPHAMFTFGFLYDAAQRAFSADIAMYHTRPEKVNGSTLELFANVQPQVYNSLRTGSVGSFAGEKLAPITKQYYMDWTTTTFAVSRTVLSRLYASFRRTSLALTAEYASANLTIACSIQSVPAAAPVYNPNSLGFDPASHPEKDLLNIGIAFQWEGAEATKGLEQACKAFTMEIDRIAKASRASDEHLYMNYAGSWQNVLSGYGRENLENMVNVSKKYDTKGMFQKQVTGGFKLTA